MRNTFYCQHGQVIFVIFEFNSDDMVTVIKKGASPDEIKRKIQKAFKGKKVLKVIDLAGKLQSDIDPLEFQNKIRNEWS